MSKIVVVQMNDMSVDVHHLNVHNGTVSALSEFTIDFNNKVLSDMGINEADNIGYRINKELRDNKISTRNAIFTINSASILGRKVSVPKQRNEKAFLELLVAKVKTDNVFPISIDDYYITYSKVGSHIEQEEERQNIFSGVSPDEDEFELHDSDDSSSIIRTVGADKTESYAYDNNFSSDNTNAVENKVIDVNSDFSAMELDSKPQQVVQKKSKTGFVTDAYSDSDAANASNQKGTVIIDCIAYICSKNVIDGIIKVAANAKLNILNIEYAGNSIYQYVTNYVNISGNTGRPKTSDYIVVHVNDNNTIVSAVNDGVIVQQKSVSFCYKDICSLFYAQSHIFNLHTPDEVFDFINRCNFLDTESNYLSTEFGNLDPTDTNDILTIQNIQGVQSDVIDGVILLIDQINAFIVQCRADNIRPELVYYYNERDNFPDIISSIVHSIKLDVIPVKSGPVSSLVAFSSVINPIDFSLAINTDKAATKKVRRFIFIEAIVSVWILTIMIAYNILSYNQALHDNKELAKKIETANEAKAAYDKFRRIESDYNTVLEFQKSNDTVLQHFDEILEAVEKSMPVRDFKIGSISASDITISFDVTAGSKSIIIKFVQNLEATGYFDSVTYSNISESLESDDFSTGHSASSNIMILFPFDEEASTDQAQPQAPATSSEDEIDLNDIMN